MKNIVTTTKCHNIFAMCLFLVVMSHSLIIFILFILTYKELPPSNGGIIVITTKCPILTIPLF